MPDAQLTTLLDDLRTELNVASNPERQALAQLKLVPRGGGAAELPYADEPFKIWEDLHRQFPEDSRTVHHLAIMYHARAFDLEQSDDPNSSDTDWQRALELWHMLWLDDAYWRSLADLLDPDVQDPFPQVRESLPDAALQVHFDIARDPATRNYRARRHVAFALSSPFPDGCKLKARRGAYESATAHLPDDVWSASTYDVAILRPALEAISGYLDLDDDLAPALADLLAILTRLQTGYVQRTNAEDARDEWEGRLREMRAIDERYGARIRRLGHDPTSLGPEVLADLAMWHTRMGQALRILRSFDCAAEHYGQALTASRLGVDDQENVLETEREWALCTLLSARERASGNSPMARELLESVSGISLSPTALLIRSQALLELQEFEHAEMDCEQALRNSGQGLDEDSGELEAACREHLRMIRDVKSRRTTESGLDRAMVHMRTEKWSEAIQSLDEALDANAEDCAGLLLRAECHMRRLEAHRARADLDRAEELIQESADTAVLETISRRRRELNDLQDELITYGGADALGLQRQATLAFGSQRFDEAEELLQRALDCARPEGKDRLLQELQTCRARLRDGQ